MTELYTIKNNLTARSFLNEVVRLEIIREQFRDIIIENLEKYQALLPVISLGERETHLKYLKWVISGGKMKLDTEIWRLRPTVETGGKKNLEDAWFNMQWVGSRFREPHNLFLVHALLLSLANLAK